MLEIALDENQNNIFLNQVRPVFLVQEFQNLGLDSYRQKARELISQYAEEPIVIVHNHVSDFSLNKFALALFIESCLQENKIDCVVLKVKNAMEATQNYKPYVALCVALKFAMRLSQEKVSTAYQEIFDTGYLGLYISKDYLTQTATFFLKNGKNLLNIEGKNLEDALVIIGIMKAFSLAQLPYTIQAKFKFDKQEPADNIENIVQRVCNFVIPYLPA